MTLPLNPLKRSYDRKVSPFAVAKPSGGHNVKIGNSFGLPAGESCPGKTEACSRCYAATIENIYKGVNAQMQHNLHQLKAAKTVPAMAHLLGGMIDEFRFEVDHESRRTGRTIPLTFRIHWDGDFYSVPYAKAWRRVILANPDVRFWVYTRSFTSRCNVVPILADLENLALYLSADEYNLDIARQVASAHPTVKLALLAKTFEAALEIAGDTPAVRCPENAKRIPLVSDDGVGACLSCNVCPSARKGVLFSITHH